ncbi:MAG: hypothetical protein AAGF23_09795 [Acidobacteriota bacterium]
MARKASPILQRHHGSTHAVEPRPGAGLVFLDGPYDVLAERLRRRSGHFMPVSLLESQLETLEAPGVEALHLDFRKTPDLLVSEILRHFFET